MNTTIAEIFEKNDVSKVTITISVDADVFAALKKIQDQYKTSRSESANRILRHVLIDTKSAPKKKRTRASKAQVSERNEKIMDMFVQGYSFAQIAEQFSISDEYVRQIVMKYKAMFPNDSQASFGAA